MDQPKYIVVEGVIGSGKAALAKALADKLKGRLLKDAGADNPFLKDYYRDPRSFAFSAQMFYLLNRHRQQREFAQGELFAQATVSDYLFERDRVFAYLALSDTELAMYEQLYQMLTREPLPKPDVVVYLQASTDVLVSRLRARGLLGEKGLTATLLEELGKAYNEFFFNYSGAPLLVVNTNDLDVSGSAEDMSDIMDRALEMRGGTQYYTPKK